MSQHPQPQDTPRSSRSQLSPGQHPFSRALIVVLGIIGISLCFGLSRVVDVALSGALRQHEAPRHVSVTTLRLRDSAADGATCVDAMLVEVPSASAEAISL